MRRACVIRGRGNDHILHCDVEVKSSRHIRRDAD
jgi:hypothetical protein